MFTKTAKDSFIATLIAMSVVSVGVVFAETFANSLGYTHNPINQIKDVEK